MVGNTMFSVSYHAHGKPPRPDPAPRLSLAEDRTDRGTLNPVPCTGQQPALETTGLAGSQQSTAEHDKLFRPCSPVNKMDSPWYGKRRQAAIFFCYIGFCRGLPPPRGPTPPGAAAMRHAKHAKDTASGNQGPLWPEPRVQSRNRPQDDNNDKTLANT